jgi:hypothetical protein
MNEKREIRSIKAMWRKVANRIRRQRIDPYRNDGGTVIANVRRNGMKTGDRQPTRSALQLWLSRDKLFPQDTFCTLSLGSGRKLALTPSKTCLRGMSRSVSAVRGRRLVTAVVSQD